ncbi:Ribonucleases P/MRP subunit Pop8-like domain-containing protein [Pleurotus pulmonarius]
MKRSRKRTSSVIQANWHYLLLAASSSPGVSVDVLSLRQAIQESVASNHGMTMASVTLDILWWCHDNKRMIIRLDKRDAVKVMAALAASNSVPRLSVISDTAFLPALIAIASTESLS